MSKTTQTGRTLALLTTHEKWRGVFVVFMMIGLALMEAAGVASVVPFLAVLGNPGLVETSPALAWLYQRGAFETVDAFLFALGVGAFLLVVASAGFRIANTYAVNRYVQMREYALSVRLLTAYLRQPYAFFLNRNSADLSKSVLEEVRQVITLTIKPLFDLISHGLVALVLIGLLVVVDPIVAAAVGFAVGGVYGTIYLGIRSLLRRMGTKRIAANLGRYQAASEAFGGIKDLKVLGRERAYLKRFRKPAAAYARYQYRKATLSAAPKYLIEAVAFGGILSLALFLMAVRGDLGTVLPLLGVYAFAGYRLIPSAQHIFASISSLRFGGPAVDAVYEDLAAAPADVNNAVGPPLVLHEEIRFENMSFRYPGAQGAALQGLEMAVPSGTSLGFVGHTGAGKTTAVDLILGLLEPTDGDILVDGRSLREVGLRRWQQIIGYVPQTIYLSDGSVTDNIAFGIDETQVDHGAVERAARIARIHDFIESELPQGYDTDVGERGVRLSGGQRQRIGIARALYHDPQVVVLDEATAALDTATERAVMQALDGLSGEKTVIMIAHRLSTVERCDQIVVLEHGRVAGVGSYDELKASNAVFRALAVA